MKKIKVKEYFEKIDASLEVSNLGRLRYRGKIKTPTKCKRGYLYFSTNVKAGLSVHRLVAQTFIPNPDNLPCVNHKNGNRTDNRVVNLEWCSYAYNNTYGNRLKLCLDTFIQSGHNHAVTAVKNGVYTDYVTIAHASKATGVSRSRIRKILKGEVIPTDKGYTFVEGEDIVYSFNEN